MELETNTSGDKSPDISDAERRAASSRQTTVAPLHQDVVAEDDSEEMTVNQHILEGPLANSPSESESTTGSGTGIVLSTDVSKPFALVAVGIIVAAAIIAMFIVIW